MATIKQIQATKKIVETHGSVSRAMLEVGYTPATAKNPSNLTNSKGFKELCDQMGLSDEFLINALHDDIKAKPKRREKELRLAFQIKNKLSPSEGGDTTNNLIILGGDQAARIARRTIARLSGSEGTPDRLPDSNQPEVRTELAP